MKAQVITKTKIDKTVIGNIPCYRRRECNVTPVYKSKTKKYAYTTITYQFDYVVDGQDEEGNDILKISDIGKPVHESTIYATKEQLDAFSELLTYPANQKWSERALWETEQVLLGDTTADFIKNPGNPSCQLGEPSDWEIYN